MRMKRRKRRKIKTPKKRTKMTMSRRKKRVVELVVTFYVKKENDFEIRCYGDWGLNLNRECCCQESKCFGLLNKIWCQSAKADQEDGNQSALPSTFVNSVESMR